MTGRRALAFRKRYNNMNYLVYPLHEKWHINEKFRCRLTDTTVWATQMKVEFNFTFRRKKIRGKPEEWVVIEKVQDSFTITVFDDSLFQTMFEKIEYAA